MSPILLVIVAIASLVVASVVLWIVQEFTRSPVASAKPLSDVGGSPAGLDFIPCPSLLADAPPLAMQPRPLVAQVHVMGRGQHIDRYCADDVAVTITSDRLWIDVDGKDSVRIYRIKRLSIDDRRVI